MRTLSDEKGIDPGESELPFSDQAAELAEAESVLNELASVFFRGSNGFDGSKG